MIIAAGVLVAIVVYLLNLGVLVSIAVGALLYLTVVALLSKFKLID